MNAWQRKSAALEFLPAIPAPLETTELVETVLRLEAGAVQFAACERLAREARAACAEAADELRRQAAESLCPLCGAEVDPERLLATVAAGLGEHAHD